MTRNALEGASERSFGSLKPQIPQPQTAGGSGAPLRRHSRETECRRAHNRSIYDLIDPSPYQLRTQIS